MIKLVSALAVGLGLVTMGCQEQAARPPETPHAAGANATPPATPPPSPQGGAPSATPGDHPGQGGAWPHHGGGEAGNPHGEHGGMGMGHHGEAEHHDAADADHHGSREGMRKKHSQRMASSGGHMGPPEGGAEMMRELAMLGVHFYPPPVLIRRATEIGLTPDQVTKLRQEMLTTHGKSIDLHAKIEHGKLEIARLLSADKVDEKAEAEMHKLHVGAMLRVRAMLTPEQRQKLDAHKPPHPGPKAGMGPMGQADDDDDGEDEDDDAEG